MRSCLASALCLHGNYENVPDHVLCPDVIALFVKLPEAKRCKALPLVQAGITARLRNPLNMQDVRKVTESDNAQYYSLCRSRTSASFSNAPHCMPSSPLVIVKETGIIKALRRPWMSQQLSRSETAQPGCAAHSLSVRFEPGFRIRGDALSPWFALDLRYKSVSDAFISECAVTGSAHSIRYAGYRDHPIGSHLPNLELITHMTMGAGALHNADPAWLSLISLIQVFPCPCTLMTASSIGRGLRRNSSSVGIQSVPSLSSVLLPKKMQHRIQDLFPLLDSSLVSLGAISLVYSFSEGQGWERCLQVPGRTPQGEFAD